jgi:hypothetical protein
LVYSQWRSNKRWRRALSASPFSLASAVKRCEKSGPAGRWALSLPGLRMRIEREREAAQLCSRNLMVVTGGKADQGALRKALFR